MEIMNAEPHLIGKLVTVVYRIDDPTEWRKTNPLKYQHHGLTAVGVSIGDLMERRDSLRTELERIAARSICHAPHEIAEHRGSAALTRITSP